VNKARLVSRLRSAARAGRDTVRKLVRRRREFKPKFPSGLEVISALRNDVPVLADVKAVARSGALWEARKLLMDYFRERSAPRFFVDPAGVNALARRLGTEHPDWREDEIRNPHDWGHFVFGRGAEPPSRTGLPDWNELPLGPGADTVYRHRAHYFAFAAQLGRAGAYGAPTLATLKALIESWVTATEGRIHSPAYLSPLIAVHRTVALTWTWAFVAAADERDVDLEHSILKIILADARFVYSKLGTSVANNHLLGDAFLMLYLGMLYPEFDEAGRWRREGEELFLRELRRQVYEDGTSFEHSVHYHELVCEMLTAIVLLARRNGIRMDAWVEQRHRRMLEFQAALAGPEACGMPIGDAVETHLLPLDRFEGVGAAAHREILRALYDPSFPGTAPGAPGQERAAWLLGGQLAPTRPDQRDGGPMTYPDGGFVVLTDSALDGTMVFRTGPAPDSLCSPGHMHADLLSIYLRLRGLPVIVEAGTFTYRAARSRWPEDEPAWRAYFLGPAAHSGLCIEGRDPLARISGDFPGGPLRSRVVSKATSSGAGLTWTEARVAGDTAYHGHVRSILHVAGQYWLVCDLLPPAAIDENAWLALQFSHKADVRRQGGHAVATTVGDAQLLAVLSQSSREPILIKAAREPIGGWVSPRYGDLEPAICCRIATTHGPTAIATLLEPVAHASQIPTVEVEIADSGAMGIRIARGAIVDYLIVPRDEPNLAADFFGIEFRGIALWLRAENDRPVEFRAVGGQEVRSNRLGVSAEMDSVRCSPGWRWPPSGPSI
jgi:hypothetical protein